MAEKRKGQTHKVVLDLFRNHCTEPFFFSQPIANKNALEWLMQRREEANYKIARFPEPEVPEHFRKIVDSGIRLAIQAYFGPDRNLFLFDPDHAAFAFPLVFLAQTVKRSKIGNVWNASSDQEGFLKTILADRKGPIAELRKAFI